MASNEGSIFLEDASLQASEVGHAQALRWGLCSRGYPQTSLRRRWKMGSWRFLKYRLLLLGRRMRRPPRSRTRLLLLVTSRVNVFAPMIQPPYFFLWVLMSLSQFLWCSSSFFPPTKVNEGSLNNFYIFLGIVYLQTCILARLCISFD